MLTMTDWRCDDCGVSFRCSGTPHYCPYCRRCRLSPAGERRVWFAQCLCPKRHCIMGAGGEAEHRAEAEEKILRALKKRVREFLQNGVFNPHCGLCHANQATWRYEVRRTQWATMAEAQATIDKVALENELTGRYWGELNGPPTKH